MSGGGNLPIGPGIWGFIAFFVLAVALWFLVRNMNSRLRRMAYRDRDRAEQFAAGADADGTKDERPATDTPEPDADASGDDPRPSGEAPGEAPRP
ncbi:hypothetical protein LJR027_003118 [Terrabacter sp. LjRoot27]|uniref:hypothetical protein n=1 Tax=Terrabacter sp. LjRoot27 TaxID=3342306 RepID=UPI003ECEE649